MRHWFALLGYELRIAKRYTTDWIINWLFFVLVVSLFPLTLPPESPLLQAIAPGVIWIAALFSLLLNLPRMLQPDYEDGSLVQVLLSQHTLGMFLVSKVFTQWLLGAVPLIGLSPLLALAFQISGAQIWVLTFSLLLGTLIFCLLGAIGAALTVGLRHNTVLLTILILPLCLPVLIFATGAVQNVGLGLSPVAPLGALAAILILAFTVAPWAAAGAIRTAV